jgi:hypothetical protein|uniref:CMP/dCMP-type deaminase domain-containing protein n=1 Tax=viral metagenome TaxID=1070528 RepID=A0A6C0F694_9ZZZZ|tara:strand:- start:4387 stop:4815 length:429 start_codon:yes stop_codon:yes gene_type:complete
MIIEIEEPPLILKNNSDSFDNLYCSKSCDVSVLWIVYNKKKKIILAKGASRPCGFNHKRSSIHAEQIGFNYCSKHPNKPHLIIIIWRYSKSGKIKPKYSCNACTQLLTKYKFQDRVFTFQNHKLCPAVVDNPPLSLNSIIRH